MAPNHLVSKAKFFQHLTRFGFPTFGPCLSLHCVFFPVATYRDQCEVNSDATGEIESGWCEHSMFLLHEVMGSIYEFDRQLFHKFFGSPEAICTQRFLVEHARTAECIS